MPQERIRAWVDASQSKCRSQRVHQCAQFATLVVVPSTRGKNVKHRLAIAAVAVGTLIASAACVPHPEPEPATLAIAYSNLDGVDGYDPGSTDVLIARLVDTNLDEQVSVGDTVQTAQYPLDLDATAFGAFQSTTHTVGHVDFALPETIDVSSSDGYPRSTFRFQVYAGDYETYLERTLETPATVDGATNLFDGQGFGDVLAANQASPSDPETEVPYSSSLDEDDSPFIDVDIFV